MSSLLRVPLLFALAVFALPASLSLAEACILRGWVELQRVLYGVVLVLVMLFVPGGLIEIGRRLLASKRT